MKLLSRIKALVYVLRAKLRGWIGERQGYASCLRCGESWATAVPHITRFYMPGDASYGALPLCEPCWKVLAIPARLPFYMQMLKKWQKQAPGTLDCWPLLKKAVEAGL